MQEAQSACFPFYHSPARVAANLDSKLKRGWRINGKKNYGLLRVGVVVKLAASFLPVQYCSLDTFHKEQASRAFRSYAFRVTLHRDMT